MRAYLSIFLTMFCSDTGSSIGCCQ